MTRPPTCTLGRCRWPATHTIDTNQPPYAGPALVCHEHMGAAVDALRDGEGLRITALPREKAS